MSHNLMFRVESVELPVTQMCIVVLSYLNDMLEDLSCIIVLVMIVLKGSSLLILTGECLRAFGYCICCNFTYMYTGKITWLSLVHGVYTCCLFRV